MSAPPIMWLVCHTPNVVLRSFGLNQYAMLLAHGGNPMPCAHMFANQNPMKNGSVEEKPKKTFITAHTSRPLAMK